MLAQRQLHETKPRISQVRTNKNASERRRKTTRRLRYAHLTRFTCVLVIVLLTLMSYLGLMANLTGINYAVARAAAERAVLQDQTLRLDDRLSQLRSHERLAQIAARLGMRDPAFYAIVRLPDPPIRQTVPPRLAFLSTVAGWLKTSP
ncbi:MAG: hypothetical protein GIW98_03515 [Candidatus Eremiobacteraeota bacterium]|nr:hypothetical protein [Candidatus Eremiobacteraeota bacterium]